MTSFDDGSDDVRRASPRPVNSSIARFYQLSIEERRARLAQVTGVSGDAFERLSPTDGLSEEQANLMVENSIGVLGMPLGVCMNMRIDGEDVLIPMAVEEPSVVAACSYASKLLREGGGVTADVSEPLMVGQLQVLDVPDPAAAERAVLAASPQLLALADSGHKRLIGAGGGARSLSVRHLAPLGPDDPCGPMMVVHLLVDVREAMGANAINSMCERLAPRIEALTGGRVALRILSNLSDQRTVTVTGRVPFSALDGKGTVGGEELARRIEEASVFAERDPYRACTHNKGIMNGVDAALIALGQDWRAVEAGAHAFAAREGRYTAMASWRVEGGYLVGRMTLPMAVGTVGGVAKVHPVVGVAQQIARTDTAARLAAVCAAAGLAQNLGAIRALAAEGIQRGHMRLHARNVAVEAGANPDEVEEVARRIADAGRVNGAEAERVLAAMREPVAAPSVPPPAGNRRKVRPPVPSLSPVAPRAGDEPRAAHAGHGLRPRREISGPVLVVGAPQLSASLVASLLEHGHDVRVAARGDDRGLDDPMHASVERVRLDPNDPRALRRAIDGCHHVFLDAGAHAGAPVDAPVLVEAVLRAAAAAHVRRVVCTQPLGAPSDTPLELGRELGLEVVVVEIGALLGARDLVPSPLGQALVDFTRGRASVALFREVFVHAVDDAVDGHLRAMERGVPGQRYALPGERLGPETLLELFEEVSGKPRPVWTRAPGLLSRAPAILSRAPAILSRAPAILSRAPALMRAKGSAGGGWLEDVDSERARRELGAQSHGARVAMHAAHADLVERGLLPERDGALRPRTIRPAARRATSTERSASHG